MNYRRTGNNWPLPLAFTLLGLLTLLSVAAWSGDNPLIHRFSMAQLDSGKMQSEAQLNANAPTASAQPETRLTAKDRDSQWRIVTHGDTNPQGQKASFVRPIAKEGGDRVVEDPFAQPTQQPVDRERVPGISVAVPSNPRSNPPSSSAQLPATNPSSQEIAQTDSPAANTPDENQAFDIDQFADSLFDSIESGKEHSNSLADSNPALEIEESFPNEPGQSIQQDLPITDFESDLAKSQPVASDDPPAHSAPASPLTQIDQLANSDLLPSSKGTADSDASGPLADPMLNSAGGQLETADQEQPQDIQAAPEFKTDRQVVSGSPFPARPNRPNSAFSRTIRLEPTNQTVARDMQVERIENSQPVLNHPALEQPAPSAHHPSYNLNDERMRTEVGNVAQSSGTVNGFPNWTPAVPGKLLLEPETPAARVHTLTDQQPRTSSDGEKMITDESAQAGWPTPKLLKNDLLAWSKVQQTRTWALQTLARLEALSMVDGLGDPASEQLITDIALSLDNLDQIILQVSSSQAEQVVAAQGSFSAALRRLRYQLQRRLEIWRAVHQLAFAGEREIQGKRASGGKQTYNFDLVSQAWHDYLMLEKLAELPAQTASSKSSTKLTAQRTARQILARATSQVLSEQQFEHVQQIITPEVAADLRRVATQTTDLRDFLNDLEALEENATGLTQYYLNNHFLNLYWSIDPNANHLADMINSHYRNANVRFSLSERLVNRLVPEIPRSNEPVSDRILGARVLGQSTIHSQLKVDFVPDSEQWRLRLNTIGWVASRTRAYRDGFTFFNLGDASYNATSDILINPTGSNSTPVQVDVSNSQQLVGMQSKYDRIPIVNVLARKVAQQKHQESTPASNASVENKIRRTTRERVESGVQQSLSGFTAQLNTNLVQPLNAMELEPTPIELSTTDERLIMRYRLAGFDQLSAFTARPMALKNSVASMQLHESCVNNLIANSFLAGESFMVEDFVAHMNRVFRTDQIQLGEDVPRDVEFQFAKSDPIRIDFDDQHLAVTIRLKSLRIGTASWRNLSVTSRYDLSVRGFDFVMTQREPRIELEGYRLRMRDELAVRALFLKLLGERYDFSFSSLPLAQKTDLRGLWVSQLILQDGWFGISVNDATQEQPAANLRSARGFSFQR